MAHITFTYFMYVQYILQGNNSIHEAEMITLHTLDISNVPTTRHARIVCIVCIVCIVFNRDTCLSAGTRAYVIDK
jgi:hypothetical protein